MRMYMYVYVYVHVYIYIHVHVVCGYQMKGQYISTSSTYSTQLTISSKFYIYTILPGLPDDLIYLSLLAPEANKFVLYGMMIK